MFTGLLARLVPFRTAIALGVMLALLAAVAVQTVRLDMKHLQLQVEQERTAALKASIEAQNAGIAAVKAEAARKEQVARKAVEAATKRQARAEAKAAAIEAAATPVTCEDAIGFLVQDAKEPR